MIKPYIKDNEKKPRVVKGLDRILDWLRKGETFATFFLVGEILESNPEILDKIIGDGHEIGFHTMKHTRLDTPGFKEEFIEEIQRFAEITGKKSRGFRAPTFSINYTS